MTSASEDATKDPTKQIAEENANYDAEIKPNALENLKSRRSESTKARFRL